MRHCVDNTGDSQLRMTSELSAEAAVNLPIDRAPWRNSSGLATCDVGGPLTIQ